MVSGKYSALAGAVSREQNLANIATNLANINTLGYKKTRVSFESLLRGEQQIQAARGINYSRVAENFTDFTEGAIKETANPLDLAIHGDGFFKVQSPDGVRYTRRGDFHIDETGLLQTGNKMPVLDVNNQPIIIPDTDTSKVSINSLGEISILAEDGTRNVVGQLAVYTVNDNALLKREADTLFSLQQGGQEFLTDEPTLSMNSLEVSNVNMTEEMTLMIDTLRTFETYQKVLKGYSALGQKQDELGTLG